MFRAVRFAAQLGFDIEAQTKAAIKEIATALSQVSAERIQVELVKLLTSYHTQMMRDLYELGPVSYTHLDVYKRQAMGSQGK